MNLSVPLLQSVDVDSRFSILGLRRRSSERKSHHQWWVEQLGCTHPMGRAVNEVFKAEVESKTNGAVKVDIYSDGTLGSEGDLWNGVRNGTIEMAVIGTPFNQEWSKSLISDWPFLYRDLAHAKKVWTGEIADQMSAEFHEKFPTAYMLAWGPNSARTFSHNKKLTSVVISWTKIPHAWQSNSHWYAQNSGKRTGNFE